MDPVGDEQLDYGDEEYGGAHKAQYPGGGAISALAEDEIIAEDDEYDDLYNDVNVGEGFLQFQQNEVATPAADGGSDGFQAPKLNVPEPKLETMASDGQNIPGHASEVKYTKPGLQFSKQKEVITADRGPNLGTFGLSQQGRVQEMAHEAQAENLGLQGSASVPQKIAVEPVVMSGKVPTEATPLLGSGVVGLRVTPQMPASQLAANVNVNINRTMVNENQIRPAVDNGTTMLFVGELHWWTTDAELESALSQYGRVKEIKFFDERASGKSKGYCQVEFYESAAATACKEGMNGHIFNGRACVVAFASPHTIKQMGANYMNKSQAQSQSQQQVRRPMNDGAGRGGGVNNAGGDAVRNYGRGGWGRGGQGLLNRGPGGGPMRGRGGAIGAKNMVGNAPGIGGGASGGAFGPGILNPSFGGPSGGLLHPQSMMNTGFDPIYMGRGAGYGGFPGPAFPSMMPPFPAVNAMGLGGVAPHVNPAFLGRGMAANGMGMVGATGMDAHHTGTWTDSTLGGWGGDEHGQRTRESSYGGEDGASEHGYGEGSYDKGLRSNAASREKERGSEGDWSGSSEKRHRDEREQDRDRHTRDHRYREERDGYRDHRQKERDAGYEDDWDRGQSSSRSRSRSRMVEDHRSRSRDSDYGKRRRMPSN